MHDRVPLYPLSLSMRAGGEPRIRYMREVILAQSVPEREAALDKLFPFQRDDFKGMFIAAGAYQGGRGVGGGGEGRRVRHRPLTRLPPPTPTFRPAASKPWGEGGKLAKAVPMTIRLLDPPLHEYLPRDAHSIQVVAEDMGVSEAKLNAIMKSMKEVSGSGSGSEQRWGIVAGVGARRYSCACAHTCVAGVRPSPPLHCSPTP